MDGEVLVRRWSIGRSDDKRSLPDARAIADEFTARRVRLRLGGAVYDPTDPVGRLLFNMLAMVAEFEAHPIRLRTREGYEDREGQGSVAGQAAQAQSSSGSSPGRPSADRKGICRNHTLSTEYSPMPGQRRPECERHDEQARDRRSQREGVRDRCLGAGVDRQLAPQMSSR